MKRLILLLACLFLLSGCAASHSTPLTEPTAAPTTIPTTVPTDPPTTVPPDPVEELLASLTVEEKVGQLFLVRCPAEDDFTDISAYHLGGYVLFDRDTRYETAESLARKLDAYQYAADIPLLIAVDEEGGWVNRISNHSAYRHSPFPSPRKLYDSDGMAMVLSMESEKAALLSSLGINVNLAPVCDISTDPAAFLYSRSLGRDAQTTAEFVSGAVERMAKFGMGSVLKHFPGYGNNADTHTGIAVDSRSLEELEGNDLIPFAAGIEAGCGAVMVSHIIVNALDDGCPASLSPAVHDYLRDTMGFDGVILTDDLAMEAITDIYGAGEAAVLAVLAGNDLLCCTDHHTQYPAVLEAVQSGRISMEALNAAVTRVLRWKQELGLI